MDLEEVGVAPTTPAATALFVRLMGGNRDRSNGSASLLITSTRGCGKWTPKLSASFASKFFKVTFMGKGHQMVRILLDVVPYTISVHATSMWAGLA